MQILTTDGDQVVTFQGSGIDGGLAGTSGTGDLVSVVSQENDRVGTYVYEPATGRFLRLSHGVSKFGLGGPTSAGMVMWHTPVNHGHGATQWLGRLIP